MNKEQMKLFQTVCFLAMMQHGKGLSMKAPKYIREKMKACKNPVAAWDMLDGQGKGKVCVWADKWHFPIKECLDEISSRMVTS